MTITRACRASYTRTAPVYTPIIYHDRNLQPVPGLATLNVPQDGGTLVRRLSSDIATFNPVRASTAHETVHFWMRTARQADMDAQGHCLRPRFVDATNCLMHTPYAGPELYDGQVLLHYDMNGAHSEYMWVRRDPDPVPLQ